MLEATNEQSLMTNQLRKELCNLISSNLIHPFFSYNPCGNIDSQGECGPNEYTKQVMGRINWVDL